MSEKKYREITIMEAIDTQYYSHVEMENLVFIEKAALTAKDKQIDELVNALEFYASRTIYEKLNQFPGDEEFIECSDVAENALRKHKGGEGE